MSHIIFILIKLFSDHSCSMEWVIFSEEDKLPPQLKTAAELLELGIQGRTRLLVCSTHGF